MPTQPYSPKSYSELNSLEALWECEVGAVKAKFVSHVERKIWQSQQQAYLSLAEKAIRLLRSNLN